MSQVVDTRSNRARSSQIQHIFPLFLIKQLKHFLSFSLLLRLCIVFSVVMGYTLTSFLVFPASVQATAATPAAQTTPATPVQASAAAQPTHTQTTPPAKSTGKPASATPSIVTPFVSTSHPWDDLGDVPFYTYTTLRLDDRLEMKVNVATGNLLVHSSDLQVHGTGIDLSLDSYYNSKTTYNYYTYEHGNNWTSNLCSTQYLDLSNPSSGITFFAASNSAVFFASGGNNTFVDAPGLNASLKANGDGSYTLTYHQSGEKVIFGSDSSVAKIVDKNNNTITCNYDYSHPLKYTSSVTDTQGRTVTMAHNSNNQISQMQDSTGRTVGYGYDSSNNLQSITDVTQQKTSFGYNGSALTSIIDPLNHTTGISYNGSNQVTKITDATGQATITFTYNNGNTVVTDQNGHSTTYSYNTLNQVTQTTDALGHSSTRKFDALNYNVTQYGDALLDTSVFSFDSSNNLKTATDGAGAQTQFGYPAAGNSNQYYPLSQTDPQGNVSNYAYDSNGNILSAMDKKTNSGLTYTYNGNGTVATQKDADNNVTTYGYDGKGNLSSVTQQSPLGKTTLSVDALSRVSSLTDAKNQKTTYTYDNLGRAKTVTYADNAQISYTYDNNGNITSQIDKTGTTSFKYDVLNRIILKTLPATRQ